MNEKRKTLLLITGIIVSLLLVVGVFLLVSGVWPQKLTKTPNPQVTPSPIPSVTPKAETPGVFEVKEQTNKCELNFQATEKAVPNLHCIYKKAFRDDPRNTPGKYYLEEPIESGESVKVGEVFVYEIGYKNSGDSKVTGATLKDTLPDQLEYVDGEDNCTESEGVVTCAIGQVEAGDEAQVVFRVKVKDGSEGQEIDNQAELTPDEGERSDCKVKLLVEALEPTPTPTVEPSPTPTPIPTSPTPTPETKASPEPSALPQAGIMELTTSNMSVGAILVGFGLLGLLLLP